MIGMDGAGVSGSCAMLLRVSRVRTMIRWLAGSLALLCGGTAHARPVLDDARLGRLDRYDVLSFADPTASGIVRSKAIGVFDATPDEIYRTVTDYDRQAEF